MRQRLLRALLLGCLPLLARLVAGACVIPPCFTCTVSIAQPTQQTYSSSVECSSADDGAAAPVVFAQYAAAVNHTLVYTFNGKAQTLTDDYSTQWFNGDQMPGLVAMSLATNATDGTQNGTLIVQATVLDITLPVVQASSFPSPLSALRFTALEALVLLDSRFERISSLAAPNDGAHAAVVFVDDSNLGQSVSINVTNCTFAHVAGGLFSSPYGSGALTLAPITSVNPVLANDPSYAAFNSYANVTVSDCNFTSNTAQASAPALFIYPCSYDPCTSAISIERTTFSSNANFYGSGGAAALLACPATLTNCTFEGNTAGESGGALLYDSAQLSVTLQVTDTHFSGNSAGWNCTPANSACNVENECGGALRVVTSTGSLYNGVQSWNGAVDMTLAGSTFAANYNTLVNKGGAVCFGRNMYSTVVTPGVFAGTDTSDFPSVGVIQNTSFVDNYLLNEQTSGGAIYDYGSHSLTVDNCTFANSTAGNGAAIYSLWSDSVTISGDTVIEDSVSKYTGGGAVAVSDLQVNFTIEDASFVGNTCNSTSQTGQSGGAVFMERQLVNNPQLAQNFTATIVNTLFQENICHQAGAVWINGVEHVIGPNVTFTGNQAFLQQTGTAGALYLNSLADPAQLKAALSSQITQTKFVNNSAQYLGGAIYTTGVWAPQLSDCTLAGNSVNQTGGFSSEGGAAYFSALKAGTVMLESVVFSGNSASDGGALAVAESPVSMTSCSFDSNTAVTAAGAFLWGRATSSLPYQVNITLTNFTANQASVGGALQLNQVGAVINGSLFTANVADISGGALDLETCQPSSSSGSVIGGLYMPWPGAIDGQSIYIIDSTFQANSATKSGGGAMFLAATRLILSDSVFVSNVCSNLQGGGALFGQQSLVNVYGGSFASNTAKSQGGALLTQSCNVTFNGTRLTGNSAAQGGAFFASLALADSLTPGIVTTELNDVVANGNDATGGLTQYSGYGGCLSAEAVNVTLRGGNWTNNSAAAVGGALDARGGAALQLLPSCGGVGTACSPLVMEDNLALTGTGGAVNADGMPLVIVNATSFLSNKAAQDGGCLWVSATNCTLVTSAVFSNCSALGSGGSGWIGLTSQPGCPASTLQLVQPSLSAAALGALAPGGSLAAASAAGRHLLDNPAAAPGPGPNVVVHGTAVAGSSAASGGGLLLQLAANTSALLDQLNVNGCNATGGTAVTCSSSASSGAGVGDGGGLGVMAAAAVQVGRGATCSAQSSTAALSITSSSFSSNLATAGNGGAAALSSAQSTLSVQVTLFNTSLQNNLAANGGALSADGAGAFLSLQTGTTLASNTALGAAAGQDAYGGCVYARQCQALLLGAGTQLTGCQATGGIGSIGIGGGLMADGCAALVLDAGVSVTSCHAAGGGGGAAARDVRAALFSGVALSGNSALQPGSAGAVTGAVDALSGVGGGLWLDGNTSALLYGCNVTGNAADLVGGGVAALTSCVVGSSSTSGQGSLPPLPTSLAPYVSILAQLAARGATGCYSLSMQGSSVAGNVANSGGGFFAAGNNSVLIASCGDIQAKTPASGSATALTPLGGTLASIASCPQRSPPNQVLDGYGPIVASLPVSLALNQSTTVQFVDPSQNASAVSLVRFLPDGSFMMPSSSPLTSAVVHVTVLDAAGQAVMDPNLSSQISVSVIQTNTSDANIELYGQKQAEYDPTAGDFVFNGLSLRAVVGRNYSISYSLTSSLLGGDTVPTLRVNTVVPDCGNGEYYSDALHTACLVCGGSFYALAQGLGQPADSCLPCPNSAQCSGGAVIVPVTQMWHSAPNSTEVHQCFNNYACTRTDDQIANLQSCQQAWYEYQKAVQLNALTPSDAHSLAQTLLQEFNCTLYSEGDLSDTNPYLYLNRLCADGYGGNLCGVCVTDSNGDQNAAHSSNNQCGPCKPKWAVYLISAGLFCINLLVIIIQVSAALGEQVMSNTLQFADIFSAIINHVQYLIVILKLQFDWPTSVTSFHNVVSTLVSFAETTVRFASITCLSDGSPEGQATYAMGSGLVMPLILICAAVLLWTLGWLIRVRIWYPRIDAAAAREKAAQEALGLDVEEPSLELQQQGSMQERDSFNTIPTQVAVRVSVVYEGHEGAERGSPPESGPAATAHGPSNPEPSPSDIPAAARLLPSSSQRAGGSPRATGGSPRVSPPQPAPSPFSLLHVQSGKLSSGPGPVGEGFEGGGGGAPAFGPGAGAASTAAAPMQVAHVVSWTGAVTTTLIAKPEATAQQGLRTHPSKLAGDAAKAAAAAAAAGSARATPTKSFRTAASEPPPAAAGTKAASLRYYAKDVGGASSRRYAKDAGGASLRKPAAMDKAVSFRDAAGAVPPGTASSFNDASGFRNTLPPADSFGNIPRVDEADDQPPPGSSQYEKYSVMRAEPLLQRWQLPGAEKVPHEALWFDHERERRERAQRREENKLALPLVEKLRVLDTFVPLPLQIFAVIINTSFVVYQGWASAALQVFSCQLLDDGQLDPSIPDNFGYYANFQLATAPNGYWQLNMNQACYQGNHLHKWTPIGAVMSFVIGFGVPFIMFLPVYLNRQRLTKADVQLKWGWIYIRYFYGRLPYWMSVNTLELLLFIVVQTFTSMLDSVIEQAALLQLTLIVILVINICMWPLVHPLLILMSFLSNATLIFTLCLAMVIGDGNAWTLTIPAANTCGAVMVVVNVAMGLLLLILFYKHMRDVIEDGFLEYRAKTKDVVSYVWRKTLTASRQLSTRTLSATRTLSTATRTFSGAASRSRIVRSMTRGMRRDGSGKGAPSASMERTRSGDAPPAVCVATDGADRGQAAGHEVLQSMKTL